MKTHVSHMTEELILDETYCASSGCNAKTMRQIKVVSPWHVYQNRIFIAGIYKKIDTSSTPVPI